MTAERGRPPLSPAVEGEERGDVTAAVSTSAVGAGKIVAGVAGAVLARGEVRVRVQLSRQGKKQQLKRHLPSASRPVRSLCTLYRGGELLVQPKSSSSRRNRESTDQSTAGASRTKSGAKTNADDGQQWRLKLNLARLRSHRYAVEAAAAMSTSSSSHSLGRTATTAAAAGASCGNSVGESAEAAAAAAAAEAASSSSTPGPSFSAAVSSSSSSSSATLVHTESPLASPTGAAAMLAAVRPGGARSSGGARSGSSSARTRPRCYSSLVVTVWEQAREVEVLMLFEHAKEMRTWRKLLQREIDALEHINQAELQRALTGLRVFGGKCVHTVIPATTNSTACGAVAAGAVPTTPKASVVRNGDDASAPVDACAVSIAATTVGGGEGASTVFHGSPLAMSPRGGIGGGGRCVDEGGPLEVQQPQDDVVDGEIRYHPSFPQRPIVRGDRVTGLPVPRLNVLIMVVGTQGDVQPFLFLARRLLRDGHRVRIATHAVYREFVQRRGQGRVEFYPLGGDPLKLSEFMVKAEGKIVPTSVEALSEVPENMRMIHEIIDTAWPACTQPDPQDAEQRAFVADAIVSNPVTYAHIHCAEALGVPLHLMFPQPWTPTKAFPHPLANMKYDQGWRVENFYSYSVVDRMLWHSVENKLNSFRTKLGLAPIRRGEHGYNLLNSNKVPFVKMWSPALVPPPKDWQPRIDVVGNFFDDISNALVDYTPPEALMQWLEEEPGNPPIFVGFGSMVIHDTATLTRMITNAAKVANKRVLVQSNWSRLELEESMNAPKHIFFLGSCPHDWLLPRMSAVVHHGGAGTTAAGLRHGKPTMICPFFGDQFFWGHMVYLAGVGVKPCPIRKLDEERLVRVFRTLCSDTLQRRAKVMARRIARENGVESATAAFYRHLPLDNMLCDVCLFMHEAHLAVAMRDDTGLKLCASCREILCDETMPVSRHYFKSWGVRAPRDLLDTAVQGLGSLAHEVTGGVTDFFSHPVTGYMTDGVRGFAKGVVHGSVNLAWRPLKGNIILMEKVVDGLRAMLSARYVSAAAGTLGAAAVGAVGAVGATGAVDAVGAVGGAVTEGLETQWDRVMNYLGARESETELMLQHVQSTRRLLHRDEFGTALNRGTIVAAAHRDKTMEDPDGGGEFTAVVFGNRPIVVAEDPTPLTVGPSSGGAGAGGGAGAATGAHTSTAAEADAGAEDEDKDVGGTVFEDEEHNAAVAGDTDEAVERVLAVLTAHRDAVAARRAFLQLMFCDVQDLVAGMETAARGGDNGRRCDRGGDARRADGDLASPMRIGASIVSVDVDDEWTRIDLPDASSSSSPADSADEASVVVESVVPGGADGNVDTEGEPGSGNSEPECIGMAQHINVSKLAQILYIIGGISPEQASASLLRVASARDGAGGALTFTEFCMLLCTEVPSFLPAEAAGSDTRRTGRGGARRSGPAGLGIGIGSSAAVTGVSSSSSSSSSSSFAS